MATRRPVILDRVTRRGSAPIWLFSTGTLAAVPDLYAEVTTSQRGPAFPRVLTTTRIGGVLLLDGSSCCSASPCSTSTSSS